MIFRPLKQSFFMKDTVWAAERLLGCLLVRHTKQGVLAGRIVETEAYLGLNDPSCHSFKGRRTPRTETMYLPGGYSYVYFTYGMHHCFNVVTGGASAPEAVLIRALEPLTGLEQMRRLRKKQNPLELCSGPGKLCQAFGIDKALNAIALFDNQSVKKPGDGAFQSAKSKEHGKAFRKSQGKSAGYFSKSQQGRACKKETAQEAVKEAGKKKSLLYIAKPKKFSPITADQAATDQRIGLPPHEDSSYWPLRFYIKDNPFVSLKKKAIKRALV